MSNNWDGEGLPPETSRIEYTPINYGSLGVEVGKWYEGVIIAYHGPHVWISDNGIRMIDNTKFRPIKSDRDKAIDEMKDIFNKKWHGFSLDDAMSALYDAGFKKQSGE